MANNFDSNTSKKVMRVFLKAFETARVLSKNVDTQLLSNVFNPSTGSTVYFKRPTDFTTIETADGDLTAIPDEDIITGQAAGVVQNYLTVPLAWGETQQSLEMDQLEQLIAPAARRIVTDLELKFGRFMLRNTGLLAGTVGTAADTWADIAQAGAVMTSSGIPQDSDWNYTVNPFTQVALADTVVSLGAGGAAGSNVQDSLAMATIRENFAGMRVMTATGMAAYTTGTGADRSGTLTANPDPSYLTAKDSMTQVLAVTGFEANLVVAAGETVTIVGTNRLNLSTREPMINAAGGSVVFTATVTAEVTLGAVGEGNLVITGPALFESGGAYNTVDAAPLSGAVVTLGGNEETQIQPNMFWHKQAFGIGSVPIAKLYATDTLGTTEDGLQIRVTQYSDGKANQNRVRFDFHPSFAVFNPFFAGQGFGAP